MGLFIAPIISAPDGVRKPKYVEALGVRAWSMMDYGPHPVCLLNAETDVRQHSFLQRQGDVLAVPKDMDDKIASPSVAVAQFEALKVPAHWIASRTTYGQLVRTFAVMCQFHQRFGWFVDYQPYLHRIVLDAPWARLYRRRRVEFQLSIDAMGLAYAPSKTDPIREVFKTVAFSYDQSLNLGAEVL